MPGWNHYIFGDHELADQARSLVELLVRSVIAVFAALLLATLSACGGEDEMTFRVTWCGERGAELLTANVYVDDFSGRPLLQDYLWPDDNSDKIRLVGKKSAVVQVDFLRDGMRFVGSSMLDLTDGAVIICDERGCARGDNCLPKSDGGQDARIDVDAGRDGSTAPDASVVTDGSMATDAEVRVCGEGEEPDIEELFDGQELGAASSWDGVNYAVVSNTSRFGFSSVADLIVSQSGGYGFLEVDLQNLKYEKLFVRFYARINEEPTDVGESEFGLLSLGDASNNAVEIPLKASFGAVPDLAIGESARSRAVWQCVQLSVDPNKLQQPIVGEVAGFDVGTRTFTQAPDDLVLDFIGSGRTTVAQGEATRLRVGIIDWGENDLTGLVLGINDVAVSTSCMPGCIYP